VCVFGDVCGRRAQGEEGEDFDCLLAGQVRHPNPKGDAGPSDGHSHGGAPCDGNHHHSHNEPHASHGHSHGKRPQPSHRRSRRGMPFNSNSNKSQSVPRPSNGHFHGGKACAHDHKSSSLGHSYGNLPRACGNCGRIAKKLMKCSRCHKVAYCSKDCQVGHWKAGHKIMCSM